MRPFCTACAAQVRVARAHGAERSLAERYAAAVTEVTRVQGRHGVAYGLSRIALGAVKCASSVGVLAYGAARVQAGAMVPEHLTTFLFYAAFRVARGRFHVPAHLGRSLLRSQITARVRRTNVRRLRGRSRELERGEMTVPSALSKR